MKYIKQFEDVQYRVGDFVLVDLDLGNIPKQKTPDFFIGEIFEIGYKTYMITFYNGYITRIEEYTIIRKATPEEIEEYKIRKKSRQYNI